jgi:amidophosphoribosyltransferase
MKLKEACGVFGIYNHPEAARLSYLGLYGLQHRGQESSGIATADGDEVYIEKGMGHVADVFTEERLGRLPGLLAIGHNRYSTAGDSDIANAQPILIRSHRGKIALGHNGNLINAYKIRRDLEKQGSIFLTTSDSEVVLHLIARSSQRTIEDAIFDAVREVKGAYCFIFLLKNRIIAIRDPLGFRPLAIGQIDGGWVVCSETCSLDLIGASYLRDVQPGEMVIFDDSGMTSLRPFKREPSRFCVFEHVYFARPDSYVFGRNVHTTRLAMGKRLAVEQPVEADIVVPVPDSGNSCAHGFAQQSGLPFQPGLIRNHYVGRTFIEPKQSIRDFGVKVKLNPVRSIIAGRRIALIDDSIVRGTTSRKIVRMLRAAGAKEVHVRISCPPTVGPCYYGIDTPTKEELIAHRYSLERICKFIEADTLGYLSLEGLLEAVEGTTDEFCTACFSGDYPVEVSPEDKRQLRLFADRANEPPSDFAR